ncbi:HEAT repeat domain-containing protein [Pyxidicoccus xibeiensis]|uniref:HEAT repeat domain-containing protein n=1 Tax=Pyxidicoccus xibeiensis TaxID=2906759 RepID=UPI0020A6FB3E|nr:HEAT repeat domain-containing protein [Pyxidicoccus xibeiensis]MCP3143805.1 HEAT repeat domain-containing protein [Pyxidicoccus xibeiensis]
MSAPARPSSVPPTAEYLPETNQWGDGPRFEGKRHGRWRFWRKDGSLQEESDYQQDVEQGRSVRYHPDGSRSVEQRVEGGRAVELTLYLTDKPTDEPQPALPPAIRKVHVLFEDGWQKFIQFLGEADQPLTAAGAPAPARPAGVPEGTYLTDAADAWKTGLFDNRGYFKGLHRFWTLSGELMVVRYHSEKRGTVGSRSPYVKPNGNPLVHAAAEGDTPALEELLALGFGHEPGAALHAGLEGLPELAKRLVTLPAGLPFRPLEEKARPKALPSEAVWVPGMERWIVGRVDPEHGPVGTWKVWKLYRVDESGELRGRVQEVEFQGGLRRYQCESVLPEQLGRKEEEDWFDETGRCVRSRAYDQPEGFSELVRLPSGESIRRWAKLPDLPLREERLDAREERVSVRSFDGEGRLRTEVLSAEGRGRVFDVHGAVVAEGSVEGEQLTGRWTLHLAGAERQELDVDGLALSATADVGTLLPLILQMQRSPVPPFLRQALDMEWGGLESYFNLDSKQVPSLLRIIALDHPAAVEHGLDALRENLYHQGTVSELAGPVLPWLCAITATFENEAALERMLPFLVDVGTRGYKLDAANRLKKAFRQRKGDQPSQATEALEKAGRAPVYGPFLLALVDSVEAWVRLSGHANPEVSKAATWLLGLTDHPRAASALCMLLEGPASSALHQTAARVLSLHPATDATRAALERTLGSEDAHVRGEAAMSWLRLHLPDRDRAVAVLLEQVQAQSTEAVVVLTLLPATERMRYLGSLLQVLSRADLSSVYGVARAALATAFPKGVGEALSEPQREVLQTLVGNTAFWRLDVNAAEVLSEVGLPTRLTQVEALLRGVRDGGEGNGSGYHSAASGLDGPSVASFREEEGT